MKDDKAKAIRLLKTARGQFDGLLKMVEEDRYCIDISNQLLATQAILRRLNREVLHAHLTSCVQGTLQTAEQHEKINEIIALVDKLTK